MVLAISQDGVILSQFIKGGLNQFSFVKFIEVVITEVVNNKGIDRDEVVIFLDNCPAHTSYYT